MVVVIASTWPWPSTMLMWLVPYSGWSAIGAQLVTAPGGVPGLAVFIDWVPIRLARWRR